MVFERPNATSEAGLVGEIQHYLELVAALRGAGHEPIWTAEFGAVDEGPDAEHRIASIGRIPEPRQFRFTV